MAQRTSNNPPFGYRETGLIIDDITELFTLTGGTGGGITEEIGSTTNPSYSFDPTANGHTATTGSEYGFLLGGRDSQLAGNSQYNGIIGGRLNSINNGGLSVIVGGTNNTMSAAQASFIGAGDNNFISTSTARCAIVGGDSNTITNGSNNIIIGGSNNSDQALPIKNNVVILGGSSIIATQSDTTYVDNFHIDGASLTQSVDLSHELGDLQFKLDSGTSTYTSNFSDTKGGEKLYVIGADASNVDLTDISNTLSTDAISKVGVIGTYINISSWDGKVGVANVTINDGELTLNGDTFVKITSLPTHADEAAATSAGLATDTIYKTSTGELRIKL